MAISPNNNWIRSLYFRIMFKIGTKENLLTLEFKRIQGNTTIFILLRLDRTTSPF